MRGFTIAHISDLHLDGSGSRSSAVNVLISSLQREMQSTPRMPVRILLITGDLVETPSEKAFREAQELVTRLKALAEFTDVKIVAGNHDVKLKGLVGQSDRFYSTFDAPRSAKNYYYAEAGLDLVLLDSNGASFARGAIGGIAYDAMAASATDLSGALRAEMNESRKSDSRGPENAIVRVLGLHHHPLPIAAGEGFSMHGVPDEPFMYLVSPATFLGAALSVDTALILHGHRHVHGLTRYSVPNRHATTSEIEDEFWKTVYVLSCPSSTGKDCDAGFNIVLFRSAHSWGGRERFRFETSRFTRPKNAGAFENLDARAVSYLPLSKDYHRDIALQIEIELSQHDSPTRDELVQYARRLLTRRAYYNDDEMSWPHAFYAYLVTYHVWTNSFLPKLDAQHVRSRDRSAARKISNELWLLVELTSEVLGLDGYLLDEMRKMSLNDRGRIMETLPKKPVRNFPTNASQARRKALIKAIDGEMEDLGGTLGLAGTVPSGLTD